MCVITGNYLRVYLRVLKQMYHCPPLSDTLRLSIRRIVIYFYVPDDDILFTNDMYIRGELDVMFDELNLPLSREEILNAIKQLKNNKGPGQDKMINEFFIHGGHILLPYLDTLFNTIFNHGYFPNDRSLGEIVPLHKKGSINGPRQANLVLIAYASSEGSGEPAHPRSLARTSAARSYKQWVKRNHQTERQIPSSSEWLGMRSYNLSWRNARRHKFAWRGSLNVANYRGITLLSTLGKSFTRILNNRLTNLAEDDSIYVEAQAGFRETMGTTDHIFSLHELISHYLNNNKKLFCAFIDLSKAFDYVVRDNLWYKLIKLGIRGKILNIIMSMYENVRSRVKFNNEKSKDFVCHTGVRQGECLSPFLFSMP